MSSELTGALMALLVPVCFGSGMVLARLGLVHIASGLGNFVSLLAGAVVMIAAAVVIAPDQMLGVSLGATLWLVMIGVVNFPIGRLMNFTAIAFLGLLRASPVLAMAPIVTAFEGTLFLGERINAIIAIGTLLVLGGVVLTVLGEAGARGTAGTPALVRRQAEPRTVFERHPKLTGYAAGILGALAYGTVPVLGKVAVTDFASPMVSATYTMVFGLAAMSLLVWRSLPGLTRIPLRGAGFVAGSGVLMSVGVMVLYASVSRAPVVAVAPMFSLNPVVALILAHLFLQRLERVTLPLVVGTLLVVAGVLGVIAGSRF